MCYYLIVKVLPTEIKKFLSLHYLATIATISIHNDYPYIIPIFYITSDVSRLYFATHKNSKTFQNILSNPHISISITDPTNLISLQLQGIATVTEQKTEIIQQILVLANEKSENSMPPLMQIEAGTMQLVAVTPHWYKLSNYSNNTATFVEGSLDNPNEVNKA